MKKSVATYIIGLIAGSILGFGSIAFASYYYYAQVNATSTKCTTSGGKPNWFGGNPHNLSTGTTTSADMWVTCSGVHSVTPTSVEWLQVKVVERGIGTGTGVAHTKAFGQWTSTSGVITQSAIVTLAASSTNTQTLTVTRPWTGNSSAVMKVMLPRTTSTLSSMGNEVKGFVTVITQ